MFSKLSKWGEMTSGQTLPGKASLKLVRFILWRRKIDAKAPSDLHALESALKEWLCCPVPVFASTASLTPSIAEAPHPPAEKEAWVKWSWCLLDSASFCQKDADVSGWHTQKNPFLVALGWWALDQCLKDHWEAAAVWVLLCCGAWVMLIPPWTRRMYVDVF